MVPPEVLRGPRLKVKRANGHIDELRLLTEPLLSRDLHVVQIHPDTPWPEGQLGPYMLMYQPMKPIPETLALIIGDAVHNLRGALDHLATSIIRTIDKKAQPHFPMCKKREDLKTGSAAATICLIEKALPGTDKLLFEKIRPENGPEEHLWAFHGLDNDDKHNLLTPVVTIANIFIPLVRSGQSQAINCTTRNDAAREFTIEVSYEPITVQQDFETTVEVAFGIAHDFDGQAVVPTLTQLAQLVSKTLDAFEVHITGKPVGHVIAPM
jgi:hypothetical protein